VGAQGNGGAVSVENARLEIHTSGDNAFGLVAQSIGGGGGIATVANPDLGTSQASHLGGTDSATGNGGAVAITLLAGSEIHTTGAGAHALVVQSIGGGGGLANPNSSYSGLNTTPFSSGVDNQAIGSGGALQVSVDADISTSGAGAYGVVLQTIAGGGGIIDYYAGSTGSSSTSSGGELNGAINFTQSGTIVASGSNSVGVFAQNIGADQSGTAITLTVNGPVTGSSGIWVDGGSGNTVGINSSGRVTGTDGFAVRYTGNTNVVISNSGQVAGSIEVGTLGVMNNSGLFYSGYEVAGVDAAVNNTGTLDPGGDNGSATQTTFTDSSYLNNDSLGTLKFDIYSGLDYDSLAFATAFNQSTIDGSVVAEFHYNPVFGQVSYTLIGPGNIVYGDLSAFTVAGLSPEVQWSYSTDETNALYLTLDVVPEPGVIQLTILSAVGIILFHRFRRGRVSLR
jgi:hypothetical protein